MDFELGCEECGIEDETLIDTILGNQSMRLCEKCARNTGALILKEEKNKVREKWNSRNSQKPEQVYGEEPKVTLQGLWDRYEQKMGERNTLEKKRKIAVLEEKKFLEELERKKQLENRQVVRAVEGNYDPDYRLEDEKEFDNEASKKLDIKGFFKQTFKFLKTKEKVSSEESGESEESEVPDMTDGTN